jgi:hypothetical protein
MAAPRFRGFLHGRWLPISGLLMTEMMTMPVPTRRAEGLPAGYGVLPIAPWQLDPAHELPGRLCPMWVMPPPARPLSRRIMTALGQLGTTIAAGAGLMVLASYLVMPG